MYRYKDKYLVHIYIVFKYLNYYEINFLFFYII